MQLLSKFSLGHMLHYFVQDDPKTDLNKRFTISEAALSLRLNGCLGLANVLQEKGYKFVMTCQWNRPSWLFANGLEKKLKFKGNVNWGTNEEVQL